MPERCHHSLGALVVQSQQCFDRPAITTILFCKLHCCHCCFGPRINGSFAHSQYCKGGSASISASHAGAPALASPWVASRSFDMLLYEVYLQLACSARACASCSAHGNCQGCGCMQNHCSSNNHQQWPVALSGCTSNVHTTFKGHLNTPSRASHTACTALTIGTHFCATTFLPTTTPGPTFYATASAHSSQTVLPPQPLVPPPTCVLQHGYFLSVQLTVMPALNGCRLV